MTRNDIADYLGLTVETVSRTFTKLRVEGLIALPTPNRVEIRDREQLEDFAYGQSEPEL
jgi:CRP/FNR family transcriptional regulator